jgi:hypothetical protein
MRVLLVAALTAMLATGAAPALVHAQLGEPTGPGQAVPPPPAQCPQTIACTYSEHNSLPGGYRFQMLQVCGANCTTQYWVSDIADGQLLLAIEPVRGGGIIAIGPATGPEDAHPPLRVVLPDYLPSDALCCPSQFRDTSYRWDAARRTLVVSASRVIPAGEFGGWEAMRQELQGEQFFDVFPTR